jgi:thiamine-monophosphate kinase
MGGTPRCFLLSLALPASQTGSWLQNFLRGLQRAARHLRCVLAGGDTTQGRGILINLAVVGEAKRGTQVLRSSARPGDILFASGRLGEAELGLRRIRGNKQPANRRDPLLRKHLYPEPRLALGRWLAESRLVSAMMDLSDGLSTDLPRLCAASGVGARIFAAKIPMIELPKGAREGAQGALELAVHGGDDYELLFTVPQRKRTRIPRSIGGLSITAIGQITREQTLLLVHDDGHEAPLPNRGWDPFRSPR